jgi:hypothetical protein
MEREIFMVELNSARIIREARQIKYYCPLSDAEMDFIFEHEKLTDSEKLIWLKIAQKSALDPNFSCLLTLKQIAAMVRKMPDTIYRAIRNLKNLGFLEGSYEHGDKATKYLLTLPVEGLEVLQAAPQRKKLGEQTKSPYTSEKNPGTPGELSDTPPDKNPPLLIYNNINNKKHNHNLNAPIAEPETLVENSVQNADALVCEFKKLIQEKYQHLTPPKRPRAARSHFSAAQLRIIDESLLELAAIEGGQQIQAAQTQVAQFTQKLAEATAVPESRPKPKNCKLVEFEFENEYFLVEDTVKDQILNEIPSLYHQKQIKGEAAKTPIKTLLKEILYYVAKAGSKALDACQLKRFFVARKLCKNGAWERPNGLERQASAHREQKWQKEKINEYKFAKEFTEKFITNVA